MSKIGQTARKIRDRYGRRAAPLVLLVCAALAALIFIQLKTRWTIIARAVLYYPLGLLLPGYLLARGTARRDSASELYGFSLLFGAGLAILSYFLDSLIRMPVFTGRFFSCFLGPACSIPAAVLLFLDVRSGRRDRRSLIPDLRILALCAAAVVIALGGKAMYAAAPDESVAAISAPNVDAVWNVSNMAALNRGWPTDTLQYLGKGLRSNSFANIFRVAAGRFIGTRTQAEMMYVFSCLFLVPLLVFSLDALGQSFTDGDRKRSFRFVLVFLFVGFLSRAVLFFYNIDWAYTAAYLTKLGKGATGLLYAPNGIDLAIPGAALLVVLVRKACAQERAGGPAVWAGIFAASAVVTGAKYVSVVCVIGGIVGTALFQLLQRQKLRVAARNLVLLLLVGAGFLPVYYGIVRGGTVNTVPTKETAAYMTPDDPEYRTALKAFIGQTVREDYRYTLIKPEASTEAPVVRQNADGDYFILGRGLYRMRRSHERITKILKKAADLRTDGILAGAGGVYHSGEGQDTLIKIRGATGFIRFTEADTGTPAVLFYGPDQRTRIRDLDPAVELENPEMTVPGMFTEGGDGTETEYVHTYSSVSINAGLAQTGMFEDFIRGTDMKQSPLLPLLLFLLIPVHFLIFRPVTGIPFILWMKERLKQFRTIPAGDLLAGGTAVCGLAAYYFLEVDGSSQRYFFETVIPIVDAAGVCWLFGHYAGMSKFAKRWLCLAAVVGVFTNAALYTGYMFIEGGGFRKAVKAGNSIITEEITGPEQEEAEGAEETAAEDAAEAETEAEAEAEAQTETTAEMPDEYITRDELEAMEWLRKNTDLNAVAATNRYYQKSWVSRNLQPIPNDYDSRYYFYAAYGERQLFIGSWAYMPRTQKMQEELRERLVANEALFNPLCANRREIMEANGISYLIASAEARTGMDLPDDDLECVFRRDSIAIYALKAQPQ